jgi:hypothetical protein
VSPCEKLLHLEHDELLADKNHADRSRLSAKMRLHDHRHEEKEDAECDGKTHGPSPRLSIKTRPHEHAHPYVHAPRDRRIVDRHPVRRSKSSSSVFGMPKENVTAKETDNRLILDDLPQHTITKLRAIHDPLDQELFLSHKLDSQEPEPVTAFAEDALPFGGLYTTHQPPIREQQVQVAGDGWMTSLMSTIASVITPPVPSKMAESGRNLERKTAQAFEVMPHLDWERQVQVLQEILIQHAKIYDALEVSSRVRIAQLEKDVAELKAKKE